MKQLVPVAILLLTGGCHRLTDRPGEFGVYRHYTGWMIASNVSIWLGLSGAVLGLGLLCYQAVNRDFGTGSLLWAGALTVIGLTVSAGSYVTWILLTTVPS